MAQPNGTRVRLLKNIAGEECDPVVAHVESLLSVQFTARYDDGTDTLTFRFYSDEGDTWENYS